MFNFLKYHKRILFVGGLWNNKYFKESILQQLHRYKHLSFKACRQVSQKDIDKNDIIICYSIAIQYVHKLNLKNKKIILVSPLLNDEKIKEPMISIANEFIRKCKVYPLVLDFIFNACGGDKDSNELWWKDMKLWNDTYPSYESITNIEPESNWTIIEGRMPIAKLPWVNIKTPYGHMIPIDDDWHFLDKAI